MTHGLGTVRRMWQLLEPVHAIAYYAPESVERAAALGYPAERRWAGYFAWRAAPLGPVGPALVNAVFYSFSPRKVARHITHAWDTTTPGAVVAARLASVDEALRRLLGERAASPEVREAAALARRAAEAADTAGRPLAAANAALPWPDEPHAVLWHAATVLREHRGDGHITALQTHGLGPLDSLVSHAAAGAAPAEVFASRGWSAEEWDAARARLAGRGLVDADGAATAEGLRVRGEVERLTDELAAAPWAALTPAETARLAELVMPTVRDIVRTGLLPSQSTLGIRMAYGHL
ncbi:hypothetical protein [Streptomyces sp. NPDC049881]|uniref:SCO6745 family protein n=1 Tax=Streptomyces sp. NPDC049881 TaxID=3155778 RepID=UPI0034385853